MRTATNMPSSKHIYSLLDNLEEKLNRHRGINTYDGNGANDSYVNIQVPERNMFKTYNTNYINTQPNENVYKLNTPPTQLQTPISTSNEYYLRKLIKDEFSTLILPYQQDINNSINLLETKINNNNIQLKELNTKNIQGLNNLFNTNTNFSNIPNNGDFISKMEYENKIMELEHQITTLHSFTKSLQNSFENNILQNNQKMVNDLNKISKNNAIDSDNFINKNQYEQENQMNKNKIDQISQNLQNYQKNISSNLNELNIAIKNNENTYQNYNKALKNDYNKLNEEFNKLKFQIDLNLLNKLSALNIDALKQTVNINDFNTVKNNLYELQGNFREIKNTSENNDKNIRNIQNNLNDLEMNNKNLIQKMTDIALKFESSLKEQRNNNINQQISNNFLEDDSNLNNNTLTEKQIKLLNELEKIDLKKLFNINFDSINNIENRINELENGNKKLFSKFEEYSKLIDDLDTKITQTNRDLSNDNKKKFNQINSKIEKSINESIRDSRFFGGSIDNNNNLLSNRIQNKCTEIEQKLNEESNTINNKLENHEKRIQNLENNNKIYDNKKENNIYMSKNNISDKQNNASNKEKNPFPSSILSLGDMNNFGTSLNKNEEKKAILNSGNEFNIEEEENNNLVNNDLKNSNKANKIDYNEKLENNNYEDVLKDSQKESDKKKIEEEKPKEEEKQKEEEKIKMSESEGIMEFDLGELLIDDEK